MEQHHRDYQGPVGEFRFGRALQRVAGFFHRLGDENLQKKGISFSQLRVIAYVSRQGEGKAVYQKELEEHLGIRRSSVTSLLQNMEKSGILVRQGAPEDARVKTVFLTEKGQKLDDELKHYINTLEEELMQGFSSEEKEFLRSCLLRMTENLEEIERSRV